MERPCRREQARSQRGRFLGLVQPQERPVTEGARSQERVRSVEQARSKERGHS